MKRFSFLLAALTLLIACTEEGVDSNGGKETPGEIVHVTGISLDRTSVTIKEGESLTLVAMVSPSNADNKAVIWSSSSEAIATVDASGKVTGIKAGSSTITANAEDGGMKATCAINVEANLAPSVTVEANHVSAISAVLAGKANLGSTVAADLQVGFQYSTSAGILPSNSMTVEATDADANYNYTTAITGLDPDTKYYFRSFVHQNSQYTYGETKEFKTKDVESLIETKEAFSVEATKATLNAKLDLTNVKYTSIDYGFYWGTSEEAQTKYLKGEEIAENSFYASKTNLSPKTPYWYKAYVKLDNQALYGKVQSFTTDVIKVESVSLNKTEHTFYTIGSSFSLTATVLPANATDKSVEWSTSDARVATVDQSGEVTAIGNGIATITVKTNNQGKTATCAVTITQHVTEITLNRNSLSLQPGESYTLEATLSPENAYDKTLLWSSSDNTVASVDNSGKVMAKYKGSATIKAKANDGSGVFASCSVNVMNPCPTGAVDLGLSVYWATSNLSSDGLCANPQDYGDYYAWGETEPKSDYSWSTYKWCKGSRTRLTRYNISSSYGVVDNMTSFKDYDYADDAARNKLGVMWRMPTDAECMELRNNCTWTWTSDYNGTGVAGMIVTSDKNDNSIFLPAAGCWYDYGLGNNGSVGYYWSSSLSTDDPGSGLCVVFTSSGVSWGSRDFGRCYGRSVRPVSPVSE